jgi:hypothetical protein
MQITRHQLPIQPAFAVTGHSAQGKTLPQVLVNLHLAQRWFQCIHGCIACMRPEWPLHHSASLHGTIEQMHTTRFSCGGEAVCVTVTLFFSHNTLLFHSTMLPYHFTDFSPTSLSPCHFLMFLLSLTHSDSFPMNLPFLHYHPWPVLFSFTYLRTVVLLVFP